MESSELRSFLRVFECLLPVTLPGGRPNSSGGILKLMMGPWAAEVLACASSRRFWSIERKDLEFSGTKSKI